MVYLRSIQAGMAAAVASQPAQASAEGPPRPRGVDQVAEEHRVRDLADPVGGPVVGRQLAGEQVGGPREETVRAVEPAQVLRRKNLALGVDLRYVGPHEAEFRVLPEGGDLGAELARQPSVVRV